MSIENHPYSSFLHRVRKPAQYVGGEEGEVRKDWDAASARICLAFPDLYEIGMSHLGYKILYDLINRHPKLIAERAYAVWHDMEAELRAHGESLRSLETARPLSDFDVVGFSLQFELTYTNILSMLELGGIPRWQHERGDDDPLIVCGGPVATHAESIAPFVDVFLIGDGEEKTPELMLTWSTLRDAGVPRHERLKAIAKLGGFYVPSLYATESAAPFEVVAKPNDPDVPFPVQRAIVEDLEPFPFPAVGPVASTETIFDRVSVEVARGCTEGCRFCQAGMIYRPVRERSPDAILKTIRDAIERGGYDEVALTSLSTADYSAIQPLVHQVMQEVEEQRVSVSVSSLRAYGLSEATLDDMRKERAGGLTFAPEAGTQRMRDVVNKNVTEEQLLETARRVFSRGWKKMKLYFMIGLPTEEDEDVVGIVQTGARALAVARQERGRKDARVVVSVSTHVPKPHTPFQWCAMDVYPEIVRKQALLKAEAKGCGVQLRMHDSRGSWLEGVLARGDRRLAKVIDDAYVAGARFDSWQEELKLDVWAEAFENAGLVPESFLGTLPVDGRVPWDHIDVGLEEGFLAREYRKALKNRLSPPCGKMFGQFVHSTNLEDHEAQQKRLVCYDCGVACDLTEMREERASFLVQLGAKKPRENNEEAPATAPRKVDQGPPLRIRIGFSKLGRIAYSSHLDLVRLFPRWFRRAKLPLHYTEGFHPKPKMTFTPALGLGMPSLREFLDLRLRERDVDEAMLARLQDLLAELAMDGIGVFGVRALGPHDKTISKLVRGATWVASLPAEADFDAVDERLAAPLVLEREHKGRIKQIDVGAVLRDVQLGAGEESLRRAGVPVGDRFVRFTTLLRNEGSAKPTEVVRALFGEAVERSASIVRESVWGCPPDTDASEPDVMRIDLLDLESLRREPRTSSATAAE